MARERQNTARRHVRNRKESEFITLLQKAPQAVHNRRAKWLSVFLRAWYNPVMDPTTSITWKYLEVNPKSLYTQLFIKGTRIRARVVYGMHMSAEEPMTAEEIAVDMNLPLEAVQEAIAYCQSDPPEIKKDFEREERLMEASGMNDPDYKYGGKFRIVPPEEVARIFNS